jgi:DNA-binding winged helix-turn-helix (wHTH) protein
VGGALSTQKCESRAREGHAIALAPKTYDVLLALVHSAGRLVTKRELLDLIWPETSVEEGILSVHISTLRKALGDDEGERRYIETVSRAGYRFVAAVKQLTQDASPPDRQSVAVLPARPFIGKSFSERDRHTGLAIADALIDRRNASLLQNAYVLAASGNGGILSIPHRK